MYFEPPRLEHDPEVAYLKAKRAEKVGKKIAKKSLLMFDEGKRESNIRTTGLLSTANETADERSATLAANAELSLSGHSGIIVDYSRRYDGMGDVYDAKVKIVDVEDNEQFAENVLRHDREVAHIQALRAAKVGKKIAKKTVQMLGKGKTSMTVSSLFPLSTANETADEKSATLAANAELSQAGHSDVKVKYSRRIDSYMGDDHDSTISIVE